MSDVPTCVKVGLYTMGQIESYKAMKPQTVYMQLDKWIHTTTNLNQLLLDKKFRGKYFSLEPCERKHLNVTIEWIKKHYA